MIEEIAYTALLDAAASLGVTGLLFDAWATVADFATFFLFHLLP